MTGIDTEKVAAYERAAKELDTEYLGSSFEAAKELDIITQNYAVSGLMGNMGVESIGRVASGTGAAAVVQDKKHQEEKQKSNDQYSRVVFALEAQAIELRRQVNALEDVIEAMERGEVVVGEDGRLLNETAEAAVQAYEEEHGVTIDRNDPDQVGAVLAAQKEELEVTKSKLEAADERDLSASSEKVAAIEDRLGIQSDVDLTGDFNKAFSGVDEEPIPGPSFDEDTGPSFDDDFHLGDIPGPGF